MSVAHVLSEGYFFFIASLFSISLHSSSPHPECLRERESSSSLLHGKIFIHPFLWFKCFILMESLISHVCIYLSSRCLSLVPPSVLVSFTQPLCFSLSLIYSNHCYSLSAPLFPPWNLSLASWLTELIAPIPKASICLCVFFISLPPPVLSFTPSLLRSPPTLSQLSLSLSPPFLFSLHLATLHPSFLHTISLRCWISKPR